MVHVGVCWKKKRILGGIWDEYCTIRYSFYILHKSDSLLRGNHKHAIDLIENTSTIRLLHVESGLGQRVQHDFFGDVEAREFTASETAPSLLEDASVDHVAAWLDGGTGVLDGWVVLGEGVAAVLDAEDGDERLKL